MSSKTAPEISSEGTGNGNANVTISYEKKTLNGDISKYATLTKTVRFLFSNSTKVFSNISYSLLTFRLLSFFFFQSK